MPQHDSYLHALLKLFHRSVELDVQKKEYECRCEEAVIQTGERNNLNEVKTLCVCMWERAFVKSQGPGLNIACQLAQ